MWFDSFSNKNCKKCYACIRVCPVNAIKIKDGQASIIEERCIVCDECYRACPQKHKLSKSQVPIVKHFIKNKEKVVASIAPSFASVFWKYSHKIPSVLRYLGFSYVEESLVAAQPIIDEYFKYINKNDDKNYITTLCPSVINLVEKHYPQLIDNLIPVISVVSCHGRIIKEKYGHNAKVVFIGPCLGEKYEAIYEEGIDAVITLEELKRWINQENISFDNFEETPFDAISNYNKVFPFISENTNYFYDCSKNKEVVSVDGQEDCIKTLKAMINNRMSNVVFDMNFCKNGCLQGSGIEDDDISPYEKRENIEIYSKQYKEIYGNKKDNSYDNIIKNINLERKFKSKHVPLKEPSEKELKEILKSMGKFARMDEINCKACGYLL